MSDSELIKSSSELAIRQEQRFEQLNLKELGLQPQDFAEELWMRIKNLQTSVPLWWPNTVKNIANKVSTS